MHTPPAPPIISVREVLVTVCSVTPLKPVCTNGSVSSNPFKKTAKKTTNFRLLKMLRASSSRLVQSGFHTNLKCMSLARTAGAVRLSSSKGDGEPSFIQMCEIFLDNARSYVEHRLLTRPDPPGTKKNPHEDKKNKIKGWCGVFYVFCCALPRENVHKMAYLLLIQLVSNFS